MTKMSLTAARKPILQGRNGQLAFAQGAARLDGGVGGGQRRDAGDAVPHRGRADFAFVRARLGRWAC